MKDWLWYLFGNFVQHAKKSVLIFASPFIYFQYFCTESLEPDPCCSHAKLLSSPGPVPLTSVMTFPALLDPSLIFLSPIYLEQKHLLHIALLNGTDRMVLDLLNAFCLWQAGGGKNLHLFYHPLSLYCHSFCNCWLYWSQEAVENSRRQLSSQEFWSEKKATPEQPDWLTDLMRVWGKG